MLRTETIQLKPMQRDLWISPKGLLNSLKGRTKKSPQIREQGHQSGDFLFPPFLLNSSTPFPYKPRDAQKRSTDQL